MRIRFDANTDDFEYVYLRAFERTASRSGALWRIRLSQSFVAAIMGAGIFFVIATIAGWPPYTRTVFAIAGAVLGIVMWFSTHRRNTQSVVARFAREQCPEGETREFSLEINNVGIATTSPEADMIIPWSRIEDIERTDRSIDFLTVDGGVVAAQLRAFPSDRDAVAFLDAANSLRDRSGSRSTG